MPKAIFVIKAETAAHNKDIFFLLNKNHFENALIKITIILYISKILFNIKKIKNSYFGCCI